MKTYRFLVSKRVYGEVDIQADTKDEASEKLLSLKNWEFEWEELDEPNLDVEQCNELLEDED
jgi:hypothetical protein